MQIIVEGSLPRAAAVAETTGMQTMKLAVKLEMEVVGCIVLVIVAL